MSNPEIIEFVVTVPKSISDTLQALGDPKMVTAIALRRYLVDACWQRIEQAERKITEYEQKYNFTYQDFNHRLDTDELFLEAANRDHPTWETDAIEWAYCLKESQTWQERLEKIMHESRLSFV